MLGLQTDFKAYPVAKQGVHFKLFHSALGTQIWQPLIHPNGAVFLAKRDNLKHFATRFARQTRQQLTVAEAHLYTSHEQEFWQARKKNFIVRKKVSVANFIAQVQAFRNLIKQEALKKKQLDANRRLTFLLWDFDEKDGFELQKSLTLQKELIDVLTNSEHQRVYVLFIATNASFLPPLVLRSLSWLAYVGAHNVAIAQNMYKMPEAIFNEKRQTIGLLWTKNGEELIPLHDLVFNPSEWKKQIDAYAEVEEEAYRKFLDSLP